jgi:predicted DCC family thiol-disulfide oxidoreductase YuxK
MKGTALVYDGECPFCANYVALLRLRERCPSLELVNAREEPDHPAVREVKAAGLKIDEGMALVEGGVIHHGADAMQVLASHGGQLNSALFANTRRARVLYPILRAGRNLTLAILGRRKLGF